LTEAAGVAVGLDDAEGGLGAHGPHAGAGARAALIVYASLQAYAVLTLAATQTVEVVGAHLGLLAEAPARVTGLQPRAGSIHGAGLPTGQLEALAPRVAVVGAEALGRLGAASLYAGSRADALGVGLAGVLTRPEPAVALVEAVEVGGALLGFLT